MQSKIRNCIVEKNIQLEKQPVKKFKKRKFLKPAKERNINFIKDSSNVESTNNKCSILIYKISFEAIKDTGSDVNIISEDFVTDQGFRAYNIPKVTLKNIIEKVTETDKAVDLTVTIERRLLHLTFLIVKTEDKQLILIGNEIIARIREEKTKITNLIEVFPAVFDIKPSE